MKTLLPAISLVISLAALGAAGATYLRADALADEALRRRERELVDRLRPMVEPIYADFDLKAGPTVRDAQTLDALFAPMLQLVTGLQEPAEPSP